MIAQFVSMVIALVPLFKSKIFTGGSVPLETGYKPVKADGQSMAAYVCKQCSDH